MVERVLSFTSITTEIRTKDLTNQIEHKSFLKTALAWKGSVTPRILPRLGWAFLYSSLLLWVMSFFPSFDFPITPFEYSGAVLGLILVARVNSGMDRWWEARKIWGNIVNQSRNLATIAYQYADKKDPLAKELLNWIAVWPHTMKQHLRGEREAPSLIQLIGYTEAKKVLDSDHMPMYVGLRIAGILKALRQRGLDDFSFQRAERERSLLIDAIGACERILTTPIPLVMAIKTRRFILLFLLLLPFALIEQVGILTPLIMALTSYPLLCLDEIGIELQSPFMEENLSHLPLNTLCQKIEKNVLDIPYQVEEEDMMMEDFSPFKSNTFSSPYFVDLIKNQKAKF